MLSMIQVVGPRWFQAVIKLMWLSAFLHMCILGLHGLVYRSSEGFSFFDIINDGAFYSNFVSSDLGKNVSAITLAVLFLLIYFFATHENRRTR